MIPKQFHSFNLLLLVVAAFLMTTSTVHANGAKNGNANNNEGPPVIRLFMVRHGETLANIEHKVAGQAESPLTETGEKQAIALGQSGRIVFPSFWRLYASDLERTQTTARLIQQGAVSTADSCPLEGQEFLLESRLRELSKGVRQGYPKIMSEEEALQARIEAAGRPLQPEEVPPLESQQDGFDRFSAWLLDVLRDAVRSKQSNPQILMVSHSALIRAILTTLFSKQELLEKGASFATSQLLIPNTSLTVVEITPNESHPVWTTQPPMGADVADKDVWEAKLVELTWTGHYDLLFSKD